MPQDDQQEAGMVTLTLTTMMTWMLSKMIITITKTKED